MKKFKSYISKWIDGEKVKGINNITLFDIHECIDIYNAIATGKKPGFVNSKIKEVLDKCGIKTAVCGVGWKVL